MITTIKPRNWRDLQSQVSAILEQCGFIVESEKTVLTSRGAVELDVYAEEVIKGRKYTLVCECKYWKRKIPQTVIHSFRTVVTDFGANIGYIISLKGFQSGAKEASSNTNIELVTWHDFQNKFEQSWLETYLAKIMAAELDPIFSYTEPINTSVFKTAEKFTPKEKKRFIELREKYEGFADLCMNFTFYTRIFDKRPFLILPLIKTMPSQELEERFPNVPRTMFETEGYKEFMDQAIKYGKTAILEFRKLFEKYK